MVTEKLADNLVFVQDKEREKILIIVLFNYILLEFIWIWLIAQRLW